MKKKKTPSAKLRIYAAAKNAGHDLSLLFPPLLGGKVAEKGWRRVKMCPWCISSLVDPSITFYLGQRPEIGCTAGEGSSSFAYDKYGERKRLAVPTLTLCKLGGVIKKSLTKY